MTEDPCAETARGAIVFWLESKTVGNYTVYFGSLPVAGVHILARFIHGLYHRVKGYLARSHQEIGKGKSVDGTHGGKGIGTDGTVLPFRGLRQCVSVGAETVPLSVLPVPRAECPWWSAPRVSPPA